MTTMTRVMVIIKITMVRRVVMTIMDDGSDEDDKNHNIK
jgi:hypothetical protein